MYKDASDIVVSYSEAYAPDCIRGGDLAPHSCYSHVRNLCRLAMRLQSEELERQQGAIHHILATWADDWGKSICNGASKLVLFECQSPDGVVHRLWFVLARAMFSPKAQWWIECAESAMSSSGPVGGELNFPMEVEIVSTRSLVCASVETVKVVTSDELALQLARLAGADRLRCWDTSYRIAVVPTLLRMVVIDRGNALSLNRRAPARSTNAAMSDVRAVLGGSGRHGFAEHANQFRGPVAHRPQRSARRGGSAVTPASSHQSASRREAELDAPQNLAIDDIPADILAEWAETDLANAAEIADELVSAMAGPIDEGLTRDAGPPEPPDMAPGASSSSAAEAGGGDAASMVAEVVGPDAGGTDAAGSSAATAMPRQLTGPSSLGYLYDVSNNKPAARLTDVWKNSVAIKCYKHGAKCTLAVAEWKLPSLEALRGWVSSAEWPPSDATSAQKAAMAVQHVAALRELRDAAVWPGRTRQGLIDEAAALDANIP